MKVYNTDGQMVATNVKEQATNAMITNRQNGPVMLLNTSPLQTSISSQMNQSILISTTPQMANISSSGKGQENILISNVHLVSALQSPMIWSGDSMMKKTTTVATEKTVIDSERVVRTNPPTIVASDITTQSTGPTYLTIMAPHSNTIFDAQTQQLIMVGELVPNQIILTSDENSEILQQCKPINNAETGRMKASSKVICTNENRGSGQATQSQPSLPLVNVVQATGLNVTDLHVGVIEGRGSSKKRNRKVNSVKQATPDVQFHSSTNTQVTIASAKQPSTDLQNQIASQTRNNQSSVGTSEIGYSAQLLSQLNDTGALPAISCSQVSSVLSALEPTGTNAPTIKHTQTNQSIRAPENPQFKTPGKTASIKPTRETNTKSVDSEKMKYYLRTQYSVLKQEDIANNLPGIYQCSECNYLSTNSFAVESHFERHHHIKSTVSKLPKKNVLKCIGCSNVFYSKHSLQVHLLQDHEASGSEVSVMTDIIVKSQTPKEPRKEDETNTNSAEQDAENAVPKPTVPKADYSSIAESLVNEFRRRSGSGAERAGDFVSSETRKLNEVELPAMDSAELPNAQCMVDLTAQFSAAAQKLAATVDQEKNDSDAITKDEETTEDIVDKNDVIMIDDEEKPTNDDKSSEVEMKEPAVPARKKRGRPRGSRLISSQKKSAINGEDGEYSLRKCGVDDCKLLFGYGANLFYHQQCHNRKTQDTFECPECRTEKPRWNSMAMHLWRAHNIDLELISCTQCDYKCYFSKFMNTHALTHGEDRPFLCDTCGKGFKTRKQMRNHKVIHRNNSEQDGSESDGSKTRKFSCTVCGRTMKDSRNLRLHMENVHDKKRLFSCSFCSYGTYSRGSLLSHQRTHTGEKPFKCDSCDYASSDHNSLRRHKMQHSGNKPYNCPHCTYACIQASTYKVHLKSKHPGLDSGLMFSCSVCSYRTLSKANLLSHTASHTNATNEPPIQPQTADNFLVPAAVHQQPTTEPTPVSLEVAEIVDSTLKPSPLPILGLPHAEIIISDHLGFEDSSESCEMIIPESQSNRR